MNTTGSVMVIAGARPNFMKVVPILHELERRRIPRVFVHTGQHYDVKMSESLLRDLDSPPPDVLLEVGSASHAVQTARVMERFEPVLLKYSPSWVVVVGDVNSTLACALVAAKLRNQIGCRIAHVEAGLRSNDWNMPEEVNRVLTDRISDLLLTPSTDVDVQLATEGLGSIPMAFVGNVMIDSLYKALPYAQSRPTLKEHGVERDKYIVATLHRPSNVDESGQLSVLLKALAIAAEKYPVVFPIHPRTRQKATDAGLEVELSRLITTEPLSYSEMIGLLDGAKAVITDSGGLQEETTVLGVPCLTVRAQTERPITISQGTNALATWPPTVKGLADEAEGTAAKERYPVGKLAPEGWDGRAATRIVDALQLHTK